MLANWRHFQFVCCYSAHADCSCSRGLKIALNAELKGKFDTYKTSFVVGSLTTFPAFTSVSLDDKVANGFGDHVLFQFTRVRGVRIRALSQVPEEAEVLVPPPSVYRIVAVAMFHGSLVVTLERVDSPLAYLLQPAPVLPVTHTKISSAAGGGAAALDPDVEALADTLVALKLGAKKACVAFAEVLYQEGVVHIEDVNNVLEAEARDMMARAGMSKLQQNKVMQAVAPAPAPAPAASSPAPISHLGILHDQLTQVPLPLPPPLASRPYPP